MIRIRCLECGEITEDKHADRIGGLAPAECCRCGEEEALIEEGVSAVRRIDCGGDPIGELRSQQQRMAQILSGADPDIKVGEV